MSDDDTNKSRKRGRPAKCQNIQKQFRNKLIDRCKSTNKKTIDESKKKKVDLLSHAKKLPQFIMKK